MISANIPYDQAMMEKFDAKIEKAREELKTAKKAKNPSKVESSTKKLDKLLAERVVKVVSQQQRHNNSATTTAPQQQRHNNSTRS